MTKLLLTGASGHLGRVLTVGLADRGYQLRLSDVAPLDDVPDGVEFSQVDLADKEATLALCDGMDVVVHFGAISGESRFEDILDANIRGTWHIFEGARRNKARVIFASTNHTIGFHERSEPLTEDCHFRPDSFYGLSKAYGELLARHYWDKHGVESGLLRIGSCFEVPADQRQLRTWLSFRDLTDLISRCIDVPALECSVFWGVSDNDGKWWSDHAGELIGFVPRDSADALADQVPPLPADADPVAERYQGGAFCSDGYGRSEPSPRRLFRTST
jgi:uronate dehydrogenase